MKTIFLILLVLSSFAFSYESIEPIYSACESNFLWCLNIECEQGSKIVRVFNDTDIDSKLQVCKNKCQEKFLQCLKTKAENSIKS